MQPSLRSFIVSSMNSRNRHRVLAQIHLRKKGRRIRLLMPKEPVAAKLTEIAQLPCTVPTRQKSMELRSFESVLSKISKMLWTYAHLNQYFPKSLSLAQDDKHLRCPVRRGFAAWIDF